MFKYRKTYVYIISILSTDTPEVIPKKRGRKPKDPEQERETDDVLIKYPKGYKEILQEIAKAFHTSGEISKPTVTSLIKWNTDKLISDILERKRRMLTEQLKQEAIVKADMEFKAKLKQFGITPEEYARAIRQK